MMPAPVGYQDLAALIARQPAVTERGRQHVRNSTFGTIHAATFSFPRPLGTAIPEAPGYQLASLDPRALDVTGAIPGRALDPVFPPPPPLEFPVVDRRLKGDLLVPRARPPAPETPGPKPRKPRKQDVAETEQAAPPVQAPQMPAPQIAEPAKSETAPPVAETPETEAPLAGLPRYEAAPEVADAIAAAPSPVTTEPTQREAEPKVAAAAATEQASAIAESAKAGEVPAVAESAPKSEERFAAIPADQAAEPPAPRQMAAAVELPIDSWPADERTAYAPADAGAQAAAGPLLTDERPDERESAAFDPVEDENPAIRMAKLFFGADSLGPAQHELRPWAPGEAPTLVAPRRPADPDIKLSALTPPNIFRDEPPPAPMPMPEDTEIQPNETVAPKGEVTGEGRRPKTPAERLGLAGAARVKHERCLSNAIYFEARGEAERGQMAVAQVVLNRAFSGYYPDNVCDVVYQNSHRHLACQFTFACDGIRDVVTEPDAWETAKRIARDSLDGKIWLPEIGKATHYHATYVSPWWVRTMKKHHTLGIHIFYRPKRWGDGADAPVWGDMPVEATGSIKGASAKGEGAAKL